jgi:hypothetical protein
MTALPVARARANAPAALSIWMTPPENTRSIQIFAQIAAVATPFARWKFPYRSNPSIILCGEYKYPWFSSPGIFVFL